jgi:uncharacterized OsmC-like protein
MTIKQKTSVTLKASAECPTHSLANISVRDLTFSIDEPVERGGSNTGPTPTDAAIAALVGCTNVIGHKCAQSLGIDIGHLTIDAACEFDRRGVMLSEEIDLPFVKIILNISASGPATQQELQQVATEVAKYCPLSKLFKQAGTEIVENWQSS